MKKSKIQNPKSKINPNLKCQIPKQMFCHLVFEICHYFVICALSFVICYRSSYAQSISSSELINNAKQYEGKTVVYAGEVIGDVMKRADFAWINLNDGDNAIGVWISKDLTRDIIFTGSYKSKGDWMEVMGTFQRACPQHGGDLDIHALSLRKLNSGRMLLERINSGKRNMVLVLLGGLCLVLILRKLK